MTDDEQPKIIIDEGWKAQVEREREEARRKQEEAETHAPPQEGDAAAPDAAHGEATHFMLLVDSLAAQSMYALGLIAPQGAQQVMVDIEQARYIIDTLLMLREKTKGNLTAAETGMLTEVLSELQRVFVARTQQMQEAALRGGTPGAPQGPTV